MHKPRVHEFCFSLIFFAVDLYTGCLQSEYFQTYLAT